MVSEVLTNRLTTMVKVKVINDLLQLCISRDQKDYIFVYICGFANSVFLPHDGLDKIFGVLLKNYCTFET